ncbi:MAG TPA: membrane protein insertion efficiency factor YidD [Candidatus Pelethenecus faecipullorum]|uniref:Putative membrane protein insertion efficiency factor n=1 Tax=Candidatus Pelethenecus faecipullorum TaxID=2840900 RepID=A0A9D1GS47_9MOLU|nr:membrane protein insertion efficiency factor YidD [Candidatus Pelethenecus faecipullorum]
MKNKGLIKLIDFYQKGISPNQPPRCRFTPTCSQYAKECYQKFGFLKASYLTTKRLLRCNPLFKGGYDPVPLTKEEKKALEEEKQTSNKADPTNESETKPQSMTD